MTEKINKGTAIGNTIAIPKLKGKTKIELFENGKKVKEHIDENMMTNMLSSLFNPKRIFTDGEYGYDLWANHLPFYNTILGGLLLYENRLQEDVSMKLAPIDNKCVGHAGEEYSGTLSTRGTLNTNETGFIDEADQTKGYRFVWDFGTDKANGNISCACLTSQWGGNCGFGKGITYQTSATNDYFLAKTIDLNSAEDCSGVSFNYDGTDEAITIRTARYLGVVDGLASIAYIKEKNKLCVVSVPANEFSFDFWNTAPNKALNLQETQYGLPFTLATNYSVFVKDKILFIVSHTSTTSFAFCTFNIETKTLSGTQERTVSPAYYSTVKNSLACSDEYWLTWNGNNSMIRYAEQGGAGEMLEVSSGNVNGASVKNGTLYLIKGGENNNSAACITVVDFENPNSNIFSRKNTVAFVAVGATRVYGNSQIDPDDETNIVIVGFKGDNVYDEANYMNLCSYKITGYLATINNLDTPVTKTSAQTMKITYEIIPEEASL